MSTAAIALVGCVLAQSAWTAAARAAEPIDPATALAPNSKERRAVRGRALPEIMEPPELVWLRQFARGLPPEPQPLREKELPDWTRALQVPELDIPWSRTLVRLIEHMKEDRRGREAAAGLLRRFGRQRALVETGLASGGAPRALAYAALARSGLEAQASDATGAAGIWMMGAAEARELGLEVGYWVDLRRDPVASSEAVGRQLASLEDRLGSWPRALAAFHEGDREPEPRPVAVGGELGGEGVEGEQPGDDLMGTPGGRFVAVAYAVAVIGENQQALGFPQEAALPPLAFDEAESPGGVTLATLAVAARTGVDSLRALNPALLRDRTPPERPQVRVRVPRGLGEGFSAALTAALGPLDRLATHRLRYGESLDDLCAARGIAVRELRRLNGVRDASELRPRTTLVLPPRGGIKLPPTPPAIAADQDPAELEGEAVAAAAMAAAGAGTESELDPGPATGLHVVGVPQGAGAVEGRVRVFYRTTEGDSVEELSLVFGVTPDEIVAWNSLDPLARLQPRMVLQLHVPPELPREEVVLVPAARVKVAALGSEEFHALEVARRGKTRTTITARAGDTLVKIGRRYGVSPGDLARVNRFSWGADLPEGKPVIFYSASSSGDRQSLGRSAGVRRPLPAPVPKAAAVGKTKQERRAAAARPPQTPPQSKVTSSGPSAGRRTAVPPKTGTPGRPRR